MITLNNGKYGREQSLESSQKNAPDQPVDLAELIGKILEEYSDKIKEQNIVVTTKIEQHVKLYINENRFRVALEHVIDNAIQFSDGGKKRKFIEVLGNVNFTSCSVNVIDNGNRAVERSRYRSSCCTRSSGTDGRKCVGTFRTQGRVQVFFMVAESSHA
jgi:light-regulated signal transduction histidine kinase (bacteriophytochrome)